MTDGDHVASTYQVALPEAFNFAKPEQWDKWIRRFEHFRSASGLATKEGSVQVSTLLYAMGSDADDVMLSFNLTEAEGKDFDTVKAKFNGYFIKKRNVIYERAKFNTRRQERDESVDTFVTALHTLAQHCNYQNLREEMIRDRLVVGLRDAKLSEKLQLDPDLTLETALTKARQHEAVHKQQAFLRGKAEGKEEDPPVGGVHGGNRKKPPPRTPTSAKSCPRCGKTPFHGRQQCPAREAKCKACGKVGHYRIVCRSSSKLREVYQEETVFLGAVTEDSKGQWDATICVNGTSVKFKIDTGAEVTVISDSAHKTIGSPPLEKPDRILRGPSNRKLPVVGAFMADLQTEKKVCQHRVYVVKNLHTPLLGRPAIESLEILARIGSTTVKQTPKEKFPGLFQGLGKLDGEYHITLKPGATPYSLNAPRRVPIPLMKSVKEELERMEKLDVITKVTEPTEWCAGMVVVPKAGGRVRICVDLTRLNESVCRERHIMPAVEQTLAQLVGAKVFSKLDANSGFWQIPLSPQSYKLTTFITPFGRYCFRRLPFGITSAPEHFQRRMSEILADLEGIVCLIDDILIYAETQEEHDRRLDKVLQRLQERGLTLNASKCLFSCSQLPFLGQILNQDGVKPDPNKVVAIQQVPVPQNVGDVRRFLGMVNQMGKFTPNLAEMTKPLRDLLLKEVQWTWGPSQQSSFEDLKKMLSSSPVLALYDPSLETVVSADASSFGLGAVLLQKQPTGELKPVAYVSRSMSPTEQRYAQIEKEALAFTWACERFSTYLVGLRFHIETDHKPLVPLFSSKRLDELPVRVQRFRLRMMRYNFSISHVPGKHLVTADALSRAPVGQPTTDDEELQKDTTVYVRQVMETIPVVEQRLEQIRQGQETDRVCQQLAQYVQHGWPDKEKLSREVRIFHNVRSELTIAEGVLMRGSRIVVPLSLRPDVLNSIHTGHQGINKCRELARMSVWWPKMSSELEALVRNCDVCCKNRPPVSQPLIPSSLPQLPWQKVGTDLFEFRHKSYLLLVDYYSRFIEIALLADTTAETIIRHTKSIFARHGIPEVVISDNGPQYSSEAYKVFANQYHFKHITSSPYYPQSNGEAERAVGTLKRMLEKEKDPYLALLAYRTTPLQNGYSPAQLLMSRRLRGSVPIARQQLQPEALDYERLKRLDKEAKQRQKQDFDRRHRATETLPLSPGDRVWMPDRSSEAHVESQVAPRSFELTTEDGSVVRRNQSSIRPLPPVTEQSEQGHPSTTGETPQEATQETGDSAESSSDPIEQPERSPARSDEQSTPTPTSLAAEPPPPPRRSSRVRTPREIWEPRWSSK